MTTIHIERLRAIVRQITEHPETHDQCVFFNTCRTAFCMAGWAYIHRHGTVKGIGQPDINLLWDEAAEWLGLDAVEANWLFSTTRSRAEIKAALDRVTVGQEFLPAAVLMAIP